jgi:hypothetical protein
MPATPPDPPPRRARGFHHAGSLVAPKLAAIAHRRGFVEARLVTDWAAIVGAEIAALARPVGMNRTRPQAGLRPGAVLTVEVERGRGPEVQMLLPTLLSRLNAAIGWPAIARIRITQAGRGFAEAQAPLRPPPRRVEPDPARLAPCLEAVSSIGDGPLRAALETLARNVLSERRGRMIPGEED